jgi:lipoprotein-releasing system ATP-binding protein
LIRGDPRYPCHPRAILSERYIVLLELKNIKKIYESPGGSTTRTVLNDLSLQVNQGESIAIIGPSGSGKSTLLNIIGSLDQPSAGEVVFDSQNLANLNENELAEFRNKKIGFVFQLHHLLPQCTVLENVLIPTLAFKSNETAHALEERANKMLENVGLGEHTGHYPGQLSGGEQQRVSVVRALINNPTIILADEPTGSLDKEAAEDLGNLLVALNCDENVTLIVVTHSLNLADQMSEIYNLSNGKLEK